MEDYLSRRRRQVPDEVWLDVICRCARRLDRVYYKPAGYGRGSTAEYRSNLDFAYIHSRDLERRKNDPDEGESDYEYSPSNRYKGRPQPKGLRYAMPPVMHAATDEYVRTWPCIACRATPQLSTTRLLDLLRSEWEKGRRGGLGDLVP